MNGCGSCLAAGVHPNQPGVSADDEGEPGIWGPTTLSCCSVKQTEAAKVGGICRRPLSLINQLVDIIKAKQKSLRVGFGEKVLISPRASSQRLQGSDPSATAQVTY